MLPKDISNIAMAYYQALDSAHSLSCAILLRYGEYDQLSQRGTDPSHYSNAEAYFLDCRANDFLRKYHELPTSWDKTKVAIEKWWEGEDDCRRTNTRIMRGEVFHKTKTAERFLWALRGKLRHYLGSRVPDLSLRYGPGATFTIKGRSICIPNKVAAIPEVTPNAWVFLRTFADSAWARALTEQMFEPQPRFSLSFPTVPGNRFATVPKDGRTDRAIAIEPSLNVSVQLALGAAMRARLNTHGLLLNTSQEIHRNLAQRASVSDELATLDLSNASDTVAYHLVKEVMPTAWFSQLDASRSPYTIFPRDNRKVLLEKFSSMGNGYTFELETALFASICSVIADDEGVTLIPGKNFSVYGDDIIVPQEISHTVSLALRYLGFRLNQKKSFFSGPFRESCGGDFFSGISVRAIRLERPLSDPLQIFSLHNKMYREPDTRHLCPRIRDLLPGRLRVLGGSLRLGDAVLHGIPPRIKPIHSSYDAVWVHTLQAQSPVTPLERWDWHTAVASLIYGVPSDGVSLRNSVSGYRTSWVADIIA